ncbi:hypothetical protein D0439_10610 [Lysinibacillus fusiformis]|uniref:hypothetical protein n=1 Tax=Lysinibacillus TaxID=400634 RepID=UPI0004D534B6|nr:MULTISPECIES: hypothetical protein [Lysinibacillus]AJK87647.1 hypothetical protein HR49_10950 [Lysinibacillus fusiformis]KHK48787.1 hypothetical protein PI85_21870 [Lysinibacillus sp. A1]MCE4045737.1 hypothetical protein [Lysinibacillus fusiformis]QDZ99052.1 hypothetical protein D0439_10610 [Lysinibacillus fusiformis]UXJ66951.1 hypothetical protein N5069_12235 [Lysinibacillus fusiformis]
MYTKAEIKFSQPVQDSTVVAGEFQFGDISNQYFMGSSFNTLRPNLPSTPEQINDEFITVEFTPKTTVATVKYTKGSLKGINGVEVESQSVTPVVE